MLIFSPEILVDNVHWGVAPTWANFFLAIPVAMIAYTGIETVSNLAEEARDPARDIPRAYRLVAVAVFAIYFTLPSIALSALPVTLVDGELRRCSALPPEEGGFANDPVLGLVENLGLEGALLDALEIYVGVLAATILFIATNAGRDRRLADHLRDGELPAAAGGLPAPAPALQDAVARARRLRRVASIVVLLPGRRRLPRHDVLVRRDALVHDRARLARPAAGAPAATRSCVYRARPNLRVARGRLAALRGLRRPRDGRRGSS